jgi:hypothetical protein
MSTMPLSADSMKDAGIDFATRVANDFRHRRSNQRARLALNGVERQQGTTDRAILRRCDEYAHEVLGSRRYAPWLQLYAAVAGGFREGWIPDNYYGLVVQPAKNDVAAKVSILKTFTNRILDTDALPDLAYVIDGVSYSRDFRPIRHAELIATLFERDDHAYFKPDDSNQGRSIVIMTRDDFADGAQTMLPDGVFQAPIKQHDFFEALSPNSTATVRITTAREADGTISTRAAYLRVGRRSDDIVRSASALKIALDRRSGMLAESGYLPDWRRVDAHPDTGFRFGGHTLPHFDDAVALCESLHRRCPHMACVGWDVCSDQDGAVKVMEWNAFHNDIKFSEATTGPCFGGLGWETLWRAAR